MASRSDKDLTPEARDGWLKSVEEYKTTNPGKPQPFLTCTWRSNEEQTALFAQGRSKPGKIVTNARAGQSNHNKKPSPALDIAFKDAAGDLYWDVALFRNFAAIAKKHGLTWGGLWKRFKDYPHYETKGLS